MLHHVQDMSIPCSPAKNELHDDERKPISLVPKTEEANQPDADGSEAQLHRRWKVKRLFAWLQNYRRILVRYDRFLENYLAFVHLACIGTFIKNYFLRCVLLKTFARLNLNKFYEELYSPELPNAGSKMSRHFLFYRAMNVSSVQPYSPPFPLETAHCKTDRT